MSERLFERPDRWRRSVVREHGHTLRQGGVVSALKPYKPYIIMGVAVLAVVIAYQLYSRRASQQKDATQIQTGLNAIGGASAQNRPSLQVDPQVIESLQNQVLSYQEQVAELEEALNRSNQQIRSFFGTTATTTAWTTPRRGNRANDGCSATSTAAIHWTTWSNAASWSPTAITHSITPHGSRHGRNAISRRPP